MFGISRKTSDRRRKVRQQKAESSKPLWKRFQERIGLWTAGVAVVFFVAATAIALWGRPSMEHRIGDTIDRPIDARVAFSRIDKEQTARAREAAKAATPSSFRVNLDLVARVGGELQTLYQAAKGAESFETFAAVAKENQWTVSAEAFEELKRLSDEAGGVRYASCIDDLKRRLRDEYTIDPTQAKREPTSNSPTVLVLPIPPEPTEGEEPPQPGTPTEVAAVQLIPISAPRNVEGRVETLTSRTFPRLLHPTVAGILTRHLSAEPILQFDKAATNAAIIAAFEAVEDVVIEYRKGDRLVSPPPGEERADLDSKNLDLLQREHDAYLALLDDHTEDGPGAELRRERLLTHSGRATLLALLTLSLFAYVRQYQSRILEMHTRTVAFTVLLLAVLAASKLISDRLDDRELAIGPMLLAAAILIIAYPPRFASGVGAIASLMVVVAVRGDVGMLLMLTTGTTVVILTLENVHTRTRIVVSGLLTAASVVIVCVANGLIRGVDPEMLIRHAAVAAATAMMAALIIQASLPFIERAFRIATPLTLQEWGDATKPLLQRLAQDAPGTYNHSLVLGTMAGPACEAIGANGLLARVGALYHDVGKITKHEYFAENQEAAINRHDKLSPTMSLLIIVGHVKDGIEIAKEYGLPRILRQFIEEHHGTTVVKYFHHAASEKQPHISSGKHDREVPETEFRYPGPKPRGKESAILMLCDGVEGAVRALSEPTPGRIETVVHSVLVDRLNDGQFDDCEITLRELHRVEESLVKSLCRFYHGRVAYPSTEPKGKKAAEAEPAARSAG